MRLLFVMFLVLCLPSCESLLGKNAQAKKDSIVILVGIDGLRWDAIDRQTAPELNALAAKGARVIKMVPVMPTYTFVNFYALATGLYADGTGVTGNITYSKEFDDYMGRKMHGETRWWGGEPIWVSAEKQGVRTAAMFWLGSEAEIKGVRPSFWSPYEHYKPNSERVDTVLGWLALPKEDRPRLITLYFSDVDSAGHRYGPKSVEEGNAIREVDTRIGDLRAGIQKLGLEERIDIIVVSDHGMSMVDKGKLIYLDDYIDLKRVFAPQLSSKAGPREAPFFHLFVKDGDIDSVYNELAAAHQHLKVYKRADIPKDWHLSKNADRVGDIFISADKGWLIFARELKSVYKHKATGMHGYDRNIDDMKASFIAAGPSFKKGARLETMDNVEVYGMIAHILGIKPAKTDGNLANVKALMQP